MECHFLKRKKNRHEGAYLQYALENRTKLTTLYQYMLLLLGFFVLCWCFLPYNLFIYLMLIDLRVLIFYRKERKCKTLSIGMWCVCLCKTIKYTSMALKQLSSKCKKINKKITIINTGQVMFSGEIYYYWPLIA